MNTAKQKAARPGRVKAASTTTSEANHSIQPDRIFVVDKDAFEEIRISLNEFRGKSYVDIRLYSNYAGRRVPSKKGLTIPVAILPALIDGLTKAHDDGPRCTVEA